MYVLGELSFDDITLPLPYYSGVAIYFNVFA